MYEKVKHPVAMFENIKTKLWVDDERLPPADWIWLKTVNDVIAFLQNNSTDEDILISLDHDSGDFYQCGGDYINILNYLEAHEINADRLIFHLHTMNPVGRQNMQRIIEHNGWRLV